MSEAIAGQVTNRDLDGRLDRFEDKLDKRLDTLDSKLDLRFNATDAKVDLVTSRMDRMEGGIGMLKWLGPTGVAAVIYALLKGAGYL